MENISLCVFPPIETLKTDENLMRKKPTKFNNALKVILNQIQLLYYSCCFV